MRFGKLVLFFFLNGIVALILCFYLGRWFFSGTITGIITYPFSSVNITVRYTVNGKGYTATYMRDELPFSVREIDIRYIKSDPSVSRVDSFLGIYAEPLAWWLVFLIATSSLLLTNNVVFSKGTVFVLQRKFPWISMEEYFRLPRRWRWRRSNGANKEDVKVDKRRLLG